jgi:hypothetical protein
MLVSPTGNQGGFGNNCFGGDGWWILLLFLLVGNNGWGNGFGGFGGGGEIYPWMNQAEITNSGFQNLTTQNQLTAVQSDLGDVQTQLCGGFADVQQSLCNGFAGVNATVNSGFANAETAANARQMANMQQSFNAQTAVTSGLNNLAMNLQNCCCENRAATADLKYTVATEACADRAAISDALRDVIEANTASTQRILDQMCADKIDAKNEKIAELQNQLNMASLRESQVAQNAFISQGLNNEVDALYNRLNNCPVATVPVYGRQPIFNCNSNNCGCNCGNF